jgi:hypothetical protein
MPQDRADFCAFSRSAVEGIGGIFLSSVPGIDGDWLTSALRGGSRGGSAGCEGLLFSSELAGVMLGVLEGARLTYLGRSSVYVRFDGAAFLVGRAGNSHSPHAGAFTRSLELALVAAVDLVPPLLVVTTDDATDSTESRLSTSSELFRTGSGGGGLRVGRGGGAGLLPMRASVTEPVTFSGGLLNDLVL